MFWPPQGNPNQNPTGTCTFGTFRTFCHTLALINDHWSWNQLRNPPSLQDCFWWKEPGSRRVQNMYPICIMHTGDWTKDRQASQLYTKDSWEHLQAGNVQPINQLMFMESKTDQVTLDFEPISIIPILGREEACWLLWVCHRPRVFWKHSKKPQLLILPLKIIHFKGGEYVPCFISGQTASGLPHGRTHNTDTDIFTF